MGGGRGGGAVCLGCFVRGKGGRGKGEGGRDRGGGRGRWMISTIPSSLLANPSTKTKEPLFEELPLNNEMAAPRIDGPLEFYPETLDHKRLSLFLCCVHTRLRVVAM